MAITDLPGPKQLPARRPPDVGRPPDPSGEKSDALRAVRTRRALCVQEPACDKGEARADISAYRDVRLPAC